VKKIFSECSWRSVCVCEGRLIPPPQDCATLIDRGVCSSHPDSMTNDTRQADRTPTTTARLKENQGGRGNANSYLTLSISYVPYKLTQTSWACTEAKFFLHLIMHETWSEVRSQREMLHISPMFLIEGKDKQLLIIHHNIKINEGGGGVEA